VDLSFPPRPVLVTVEAFVDPAKEAEFNRWYDDEHMPQSIACPGFVAGARYRSTDDKERKYLSLYIVESEAAMETPELAAIRGFGELTPFVRYERRIFRPAPGLLINGLRGEVHFPPRPAIGVVKASVEFAYDEEFNRWYADRHMPQALGCPGFRAGARYASSDTFAKTYLALYVIDGNEAFESRELAAIRGFEHLTPHVTYERRLFGPLISFVKGSTEVTRYPDRQPAEKHIADR